MNLPLITPARGNDGDWSVIAPFEGSISIADSIFESQRLTNEVVQAAKALVRVMGDGKETTDSLDELWSSLNALDAFHEKRVKILLGYEK